MFARTQNNRIVAVRISTLGEKTPFHKSVWTYSRKHMKQRLGKKRFRSIHSLRSWFWYFIVCSYQSFTVYCWDTRGIPTCVKHFNILGMFMFVLMSTSAIFKILLKKFLNVQSKNIPLTKRRRARDWDLGVPVEYHCSCTAAAPPLWELQQSFPTGAHPTRLWMWDAQQPGVQRDRRASVGPAGAGVDGFWPRADAWRIDRVLYRYELQ